MIVGEAWALAQLLLKNSDFLLELFDDELLTAIYPASEAREQEWQGIRAVSFDFYAVWWRAFLQKPLNAIDR